MAVVLGNNALQQDDSRNSEKYRGDFINYTDDYALGITLPLQFGQNTFNQAYDNITQLKANIKNLLLTQRGERMMQPKFGTDLTKLLFEQNTEQLQEKIYNAIEAAISYWIPQVSIQTIDIKTTDLMKDKNTVEVSIVFTANYNKQNFNVDFKVNP
jgi:phage baseplate assembly protein W